MRYCEACDCQIPGEHERCLHCGGPLGEQAAEGEGEGEEMVLLASLDAFESRRLLDRLTEAGIPFAVVSDEAARRLSRARTGGFSGVNVLVPVGEREAASQIQQAMLRESLPDLPDDFVPQVEGSDACPACSAPLAQDAQECAECGLEFPDAGA